MSTSEPWRPKIGGFCIHCGARFETSKLEPCCLSCGLQESGELAPITELVTYLSLGEEDNWKRRHANRLIKERTDLASLDDLHAFAQSDGRNRNSAYEAIGTIASPRSFAIMKDLALEPNRLGVRYLTRLGTPEALEVLAGMLHDPYMSKEAAIGLAWNQDRRATPLLLEALAEKVTTNSESDGTGKFSVSRALIELRDPATIPVVERLLRDCEKPGWFGALVDILRSTNVRQSDNQISGLEAQHGRPLGSAAGRPVNIDPREAAEVPSWSLTFTDDPTPTDGTRFRGQPSWLAEPTWPLMPDGLPMSFWAQFRLPWASDSMAYLFVSSGWEGNMDMTQYGEAALFVQPATAIPDFPFEARATGPVVKVNNEPLDNRYWPTSHSHLRQQIPDLAMTLEPKVWPPPNDRFEPDRDSEWNKVGGTPRWLQGPETPPGEGWNFLFQFHGGSAGRMLGDAGDAYGFVHDEGYGIFFWQCH